MGWVALAGLALSAIQAGVGYANKQKAERERKRLAASRPELQDSEYLDEMRDLSASELNRGETPAMQAMRQQNEAAFSSSLQALMQGGGSANNVADLYGQQQTGSMRMSIANDERRLQNIRNLMAANQGSEQFRQQQFQFNSYAPWADYTQATAGSIQAGNNQMWGGVSSFGSQLGYMGNSWGNQNAYGGYFNNGMSGGGGVGTTSPGLQTVNSVPSTYSNYGVGSEAPTRLLGYNRTY